MKKLIESGCYSTVAISTMIPCNSQGEADTMQNPYIPNLYQIVEVIDETHRKNNNRQS